MTRHHVHPLTILSNLWRVLYLIIIPMFRGFLSALRGDFSLWIQGAWFDILIFLIMIAIAVLRWWTVTYSLDDNEISLNMGLFFRRQIRVGWDRVTTISVVESFYLRPFRAARLRADTLGGSVGRPDFSLLLHRDAAARLLERQRGQRISDPQQQYTPPTLSIVALALLTSNSLAGILFIATLVSQSGKLLGGEFSNRLIGTFEEVTRVLAFGLPPAATALGFVLLFGWLIAFSLTLFRYKNFTAERDRDTLNISGGILTNREYCIDYDHINFVDIRQSIATKVLKLYSMYISAVGYAKQRDDISCIIPTETESAFLRASQRLFPTFAPSPRQVIPPKSGIMRFIGTPLSICGGVLLVMVVLVWRFPSWRQFITFVGLMSLIPAVYYLIVRVIDFSTGGFSRRGEYFTLRYSEGFYLHTVVIPHSMIVSIELRQGFFQQFGANCDVLISTRAETRWVHCCPNLNKAKMQELFRM